jgi:hypothetical protein
MEKVGAELVDSAAAEGAQRPIDRIVTRRQAAGDKACAALLELAKELEKEGKTYGANVVMKMRDDAAQWARCV